MTPLLIWQLAAPHTWPASVLPALIAAVISGVLIGTLSVTMTLTLLIICVLMQSAVNTFNDYFDYVKGSDSKDDFVDPTDAVLVYHAINPRSALMVAIGELVMAFLLGIYPIVTVGLFPLGVALVAALAIALYSGGPQPISYLPLGELISGVVMGGLIPLGVSYTLLDYFDPYILLWSMPTIIAVALIMLTNNTCDIEKDEKAGRRTLAVRLQRKNSRRLYHVLLYLWIILITLYVAIWFTSGLVVIFFMLVAIIAPVNGLRKNPLKPDGRIATMNGICNLNIILGAFYAGAIASSGVFLLTF